MFSLTSFAHVPKASLLQFRILYFGSFPLAGTGLKFNTTVVIKYGRRDVIKYGRRGFMLGHWRFNNYRNDSRVQAFTTATEKCTRSRLGSPRLPFSQLLHPQLRGRHFLFRSYRARLPCNQTEEDVIVSDSISDLIPPILFYILNFPQIP